jgi:hypothetical protein
MVPFTGYVTIWWQFDTTVDGDHDHDHNRAAGLDSGPWTVMHLIPFHLHFQFPWL